ncbi:MAG: hypothetical protein MUP45_03465, partial [Candidatus Marinimicrobia bacterium]|nr:hypothetical protein [Candidatus Neomarinimicrobiota bacterium]
EITHLLAELYKKLTPLEIEKTVYLLQGRVVPLFEKTEFGSFRVLLEVKMKSSSEQEPIPFFGYVNGQNTKFVNLEKENGTWKIKGIATGP